MLHTTNMVAMSLTLAALALGKAPAEHWPAFDFTKAPDAIGWVAAHDVANVVPTSKGLSIDVTGPDPYIRGPMLTLPRRTPLRLTFEVLSDEGGIGRMYYAEPGQGESESRAARFPVRRGKVEVVRIRLPELGPSVQIRFDPPGAKGRCYLLAMRVEPRVVPAQPAWTKPRVPRLGHGSFTLRSGEVTLTHSATTYGAWALDVGGHRMAVGYSGPLVGYLHGEDVRWFPVPTRAKVKGTADAVEATATAKDPDGALWRFTERFSKGPHESVSVDTEVSVDTARKVLFLPAFMALPGVGSFGAEKNQALFSGLEYLDKNEPSSSEADIEGPGALRRVPDSVKVTIPLMAVQADGRYVALAWRPSPNVAVLFDSPDRTFGSGGHVMGLIAPGSDPQTREDGSVLADVPEAIGPGNPVKVRARLYGGEAGSVVPAVQAWVRDFGLPSIDKPSEREEVESATNGWLRSGVRDGSSYRHAYWPGVGAFPPGPNAEAAMLMDWLSTWPGAEGVASDLRTASHEAITAVGPGAYVGSTLSHTATPAAPLVYGFVAESVAAARGAARALSATFQPDGTLLYRKAPDRPDYSRTHYAKDASGLTAASVRQLLRDAAFCGDKGVLDDALHKLDALAKYYDGVPRGAQTWEVPLHTPDILASAELVQCYVLGYQMTGRRAYLDQARYWAWTGLPFVYLILPVDGAVGAYATIAVFGATNWQAPNWMGMPVQWCGLVYADALYDLAELDPSGPWRRVADGIAASGIRQSFPKGDDKLYGLLPDSFNLRPQTRNGVAINPGTVQNVAARLFGLTPVYDMRAFRGRGVYVHAPGRIIEPAETTDCVSFEVDGWPPEPYFVLLAGLKGARSIFVNGAEVVGTPTCSESEGCAVIRVEGHCRVRVSW